jgi:uncharacterized protein (TIGR02266 family)
MDTDQQQEERRTESRIPVRVEVHFRDAAQAAEALRAYAVNFSVGGICLRTDRAYPIGHVLSLVLQIQEERFELEGDVAWARARDHAVGVRFREVDAGARERLAALVQRLGPTTLPGFSRPGGEPG